MYHSHIPYPNCVHRGIYHFTRSYIVNLRCGRWLTQRLGAVEHWDRAADWMDRLLIFAALLFFPLVVLFIASS